MYSHIGLHVISDLMERHPGLTRRRVNSERHLGPLGTVNHFIEVCLDEMNQVWVMLHSGSRGIGNRIGSYFIELAKKDMKRWFINLPDVPLAYLSGGTEHFQDYVTAVEWAQVFAKTNLELMMRMTIEALSRVLAREVNVAGMVVNCHHNYISIEHHFGQNVIVTRKGAIWARQEDFGITPGSMGVKSFIVQGRENADSFHSCSHGAGRTMSPTEARRRFTAEDLARETKGIECPKDDVRVDEIPSAYYKSIEEVMENQHDLVGVVHTLKQVVSAKG